MRSYAPEVSASTPVALCQMRAINECMPGRHQKAEEATEWHAPVVVAKNQGSEHHICADFRRSKKNILRELVVMPTVEECLAKLAGSTWFSKPLASSRSTLPSWHHLAPLIAFWNFHNTWTFLKRNAESARRPWGPSWSARWHDPVWAHDGRTWHTTAPSTSKPARSFFEFMSSEMSSAYCLFLQNTIKVLENVNQCLQAQARQIYALWSHLLDLFEDIRSRFVSPAALKQHETRNFRRWVSEQKG